MTSMTSRLSASTSSFLNSSAYSKSWSIGLDRVECWWRTCRFNRFGHQSWFVCGRPSFASGAGMTGFSLSLCDTSVLLFLVGCLGRLLVVGRRGTGGAQAPVGDLCLVDGEVVVVRRGQAGRVAHGALHVLDRATRAADDVVVVVTDPRLVPCHRARGLDTSHKSGGREGPADVVHRLVRDVAEVSPDRW